ncbi:hypothetical protein ACI65C_006250 [Semiaphis heraclei]
MNMRRALCTFCCQDQFQGSGHQELNCTRCILEENLNSQQLDESTCSNDSVVGDDTEGDCQTSLSTLCSDTALMDLRDVSDQNDVLDQPGDPVIIENSDAGDAEVGVSCQYSFDDFEPIKVIGRGSYAKVLMVEHKKTQRVFAMKVIKKEFVSHFEDNSWVLTEKNIFITAANYPFLVSLHSCFQTASRLCFVMEFVRGGDLMYLMERKRKLPENHARFYVAEISLALNYLHTRGIIYRDLKLENVLLDHEGHIKLTDYGMCKEGKWPGYKTSSLCGTPNYIAPEIIREEEYGFSVDWWALGILLFEMLMGKCPFEINEGKNNRGQDLYEVILEKPLRIPRSVSLNASLVLKGFLNKNPDERLGCDQNNGFCDVKHHPFFKSIDWEMLEQKQVIPCYIPQLDSERDLANFPSEFTDEPVQFTPDDQDAMDELKFEGFEYVNPKFMLQETKL